MIFWFDITFTVYAYFDFPESKGLEALSALPFDSDFFLLLLFFFLLYGSFPSSSIEPISSKLSSFFVYFSLFASSKKKEI